MKSGEVNEFFQNVWKMEREFLSGIWMLGCVFPYSFASVLHQSCSKPTSLCRHLVDACTRMTKGSRWGLGSKCYFSKVEPKNPWHIDIMDTRKLGNAGSPSVGASLWFVTPCCKKIKIKAKIRHRVTYRVLRTKKHGKSINISNFSHTLIIHNA